uniref:PRELI/MSF1 domain-containing protein n=1 Tax=Parastrongyloides trichosuri TaxID=131310 RepID=A0A0N4ZMG3_PARTI
MQYWGEEYIFDHPWHTVVAAAWRKYPNPLNNAVTGMDVLSQNVDGSTLKSERILQSQFSVPGWAARITGFSGTQYSHEYSEVDVDKKEMNLLTRNLNGSSFITVDEKLIYRPHPTDPNKTILKQEASVSVNLPAFTDTCERAFLSTYSSNAEKGRKGVEWVIDQIKKEYNSYDKFIPNVNWKI